MNMPLVVVLDKDVPEEYSNVIAYFGPRLAPIDTLDTNSHSWGLRPQDALSRTGDRDVLHRATDGRELPAAARPGAGVADAAHRRCNIWHTKRAIGCDLRDEVPGAAALAVMGAVG